MNTQYMLIIVALLLSSCGQDDSMDNAHKAFGEECVKNEECLSNVCSWQAGDSAEEAVELKEKKYCSTSCSMDSDCSHKEFCWKTPETTDAQCYKFSYKVASCCDCLETNEKTFNDEYMPFTQCGRNLSGGYTITYAKLTYEKCKAGVSGFPCEKLTTDNL